MYDVNPLLNESALPVKISPQDSLVGGLQSESLVSLVADSILDSGGVLLRGFDVETEEQFRDFASSFGHALLSYEFGSTPRTSLGKGVYTSTEYPNHQHIPLHNEQAYTREWPMKIFFYCSEAAKEGGETPIANSRLVYQSMPEKIRDVFESKGLLYVRNYGTGFDADWQDVFNTEDPKVVESFCAERAIECRWQDDGTLRTLQRCQAVEVHPVTGEKVWFNQAHLFHVSNLAKDLRLMLEDMFDPDELPRNVFYGDGSPIGDDILDTVRQVLESCKISFPWCSGDIMVLDNMLSAHGRSPYEGARRVMVAMSEGHSNL